MMKHLSILLTLIILLSTVGCKKDKTTPAQNPIPINLPAKGDEVVARSNEFGFDLFRQTALGDPSANMMLSPLSASVALTMLLNGCNNNTYDQIHSMLGYEGLTIDEVNKTYTTLVSQLLSADPKVQLALGNAVFYHHTFPVKPSFLQTMNDTYQAHIEALDFFSPEALDIINQWASDNTMGKVPEVLNEVSAEDVMFLMNALYFKGSWTYKFDESQTHKQTFYNDDGNTSEVDMMTGDIPVRMANYADYHAIELYYGRQNFSMIIILSSKKVNEFLEDFNGSDWQQLTHDLDAISSVPDTIEFSMPKFSFDYEKKLNEQLQSLGMTDAFHPGVADLSKISDQGIFVSFVKQNSFISLDEDGTEAAAVTVVGIGYGGPIHLVIDHSFLFAIRERTTNTLLFLGKVMAP